MADKPTTMAEGVAARPMFVQWLRIVAPLVTLLVLIQAFFAGRGMFINTSQLDIHGGIGNATFLVVLVQTVLVFLAGFRGRARTVMVSVSVLMLILVIVQLGLGYSGRDSSQAAAWHVPNGVLIFGLTIGMTSLISRYRQQPSTPTNEAP